MAVNLCDYGGAAETDCTAAFAKAFSADPAVYIPGRGTYHVSDTISMPQGGTISGDGQACLLNTTADKSTIDPSNFSTIKDVKLSRAPKPVSGANGIDALDGIENLSIRNVSIEGNWHNLALGSTDWSEITGVISSAATAHGFYLSGGPLQYQITDTLATYNLGDGLHVEAQKGFTGGAPMGEIDRFSTFRNGGAGIRLLGTDAAPVGAIRLKNCFLGSDGDWELFIESGGGDAEITSCILECSESAGGLFIGKSVPVVDISQLVIDNCASHGALIYASYWYWSGGRSTGNGGSGVGFMAGTGSLFGGHFLSNSNYGLYFDGVTQASIFGPVCKGNRKGQINRPATVSFFGEMAE